MNTTNGYMKESRTTLDGTGCRCDIQARKGDVIICSYDGVYRSDVVWRFYYAEGEV